MWGSAQHRANETGCGNATLDFIRVASELMSELWPDKPNMVSRMNYQKMKHDDLPQHGPISFRYNSTTWCSVGVDRPQPPPQPGTSWERCVGNFSATSESYAEANYMVGETMFSDDHGLYVLVRWRRYTNVSRGAAGSREWAVELRCDEGFSPTQVWQMTGDRLAGL
eukprot:SAG22_NODE_6853_length_803_cov_1.967330_1_plen_166_part_01